MDLPASKYNILEELILGGGFDIMLHVALGLSIVHLVLLPGIVKRSTQILHGQNDRTGTAECYFKWGGLSAEGTISERQRPETSRGFRGHAPPENFEI